VDWRRSVNEGLTRVTGYEIRRARRAPDSRRQGSGDRLVTAPAFVVCTLRSGSTLLRVLLNSHSQIHAPHELHLRYVSVQLNKWSTRSMRELGLGGAGVEYLLWDRILHRQLTASGKPVIVDKTPNNVFIVDRLRECWPDSRFIFLLRHPAAIVRSRRALRPDATDDEANVDLIRRYCEALQRARETYDGVTVRYEDLASAPARELQRVCAFLRVPWEPAMLDYGTHEHGRFRAGLGDWADKIKTGRVQPPEPPPSEIPPPLRKISAAWGYASAETPMT